MAYAARRSRSWPVSARIITYAALPGTIAVTVSGGLPGWGVAGTGSVAALDAFFPSPDGLEVC